jgi:hypothetical protein
MAIKVKIGLESTTTKHFEGYFYSNHPEDVVREWLEKDRVTQEDLISADGYEDGFDEEYWVTPERIAETDISSSDDEGECILDEEISRWIESKKKDE